MRVSLIVSVFDREDFAEIVLESVKRQNFPLYEVIVTEDGERKSMKELVAQKKESFPFPLLHLQQKDLGNRKPLALNRAIQNSSGEYLIFIDGDCVLHRDFAKAHVQLSSMTSFLTGRRVELSPSLSQKLNVEAIQNGWADRLSWDLICDSVFGKTYGVMRAIPTPHFLRNILKRDVIDDIRGCNFSVHKTHLVAINGFSNRFSGAYGEDSDVEWRLRRLGIQMRGNKGAAIQFHLWHKEQKKDSSNQASLEEWLKHPVVRCLDGLDQVGLHP